MFRVVPQLTVSSIGRSVQFYVQYLGFTVTQQDPEVDPVFVTIEREDACLFLVIKQAEGPLYMGQPNEPGTGVRLYFEVDDAVALYQQLVSHDEIDISELKENEQEQYTEFILSDPDGYEIGIYS